MASEKLLELAKSPNVAEDLEQEALDEIAAKVLEEFEEDENSRSEWKAMADRVLKIARLAIEKKSTPWEGASNVKYPLIPTAILQFASKTYPLLIKDGKVVKANVVGQDPDGEKAARAQRISEHMSWQLLIESPDWEINMDKLLHIYAAVGVAFKKTYFDPIKKRNESILCSYDEIVIHDDVQTLEDAPRITHILKQTTNTIVSNMRAGIYCAWEIDELKRSLEPKQDYHELLEQHRYLDLDNDGYEEPYIVTVHKKLKKVIRIVGRFDPRDVVYNSDDEVVSIKPVEYFTDFHCIPRSDGKYHSLGLGTLLLHPNEVANSLINQLIDSGTLANNQGGFIAAEIETAGGTKTLSPGKWHKVKSYSSNPLRDDILPLDYKEPSGTLFNLLNLVIEGGREVASVTEMGTGTQSAQNVPATTAQILDENGLKIFTAMQRRLYRSLRSEFEKLFRLNSIYLPPQSYYRVLDDSNAILNQDYNMGDTDITPVADPNLSSIAARLAKAQTVLQIGTQVPGVVNLPEAVLRMFKDLEIPSPEKLVVDPSQQGPSPEEIQAQMDMKKHQDEMMIEQGKLQIQAQEVQIKAQKAESDKLKVKAGIVEKALKVQGEQDNKSLEAHDRHLEHARLHLEEEKLGLSKAKLIVDAKLKSKQIDAQSKKNDKPRAD